MLNTKEQRHLSLHTLSHLMQSLVMRLQSDLYLIERVGAQEHTQSAADGTKQYFERSRSTIKELSTLIQDLFEVLYITNEPYHGDIETINIKEWWDEFKKPWLESNQFTETKKSTEGVIEVDVELIERMIQAILKAVLQWQVPGQKNVFTLSSSKPGALEFTVEFQPAETLLDVEPDTPRNETVTLGAFYWEVAQVYATQLEAELTPLTKAQKGKINIRWFAPSS